MHLLGWNALEIFRADPVGTDWEWTRLPLDWQPGDIRNCSYSAHKSWIGISAEDRGSGGQVLAYYELPAARSRIYLRAHYLLAHCLDTLGSKCCFAQPSASEGAADLYLYDFLEDSTNVIATGVAAQGTTLAWFSDGTRIVYQSPDGWLEVMDVVEGRRVRLTEGKVPAVSQLGDEMAFQRSNQIWLKQPHRPEIPLQPSQLGRHKGHLTNGLSWSPDGRYLSFGVVAGLVDKETAFYLLNVANGEVLRIGARYLRGLLILE